MALESISETIQRLHPYEEPAWDVYALQPKPRNGSGQGRSVKLNRSISINALVDRIKQHLKLKQVRLARAGSGPVKTVALCAGAGGSVLEGHRADVYLTGEMRHHDILDANARGTSVILTDHTNTERPYMPVLKKRLQKLLGNQVAIDISKRDADPLKIF